MNSELVREFADQLGVPADELAERWSGRPDRIMEDIFRVPDEDGELHDLHLFPYQRQFVMAYFYGDASDIVFLKGRRIGGSFIAIVCFLVDGLMKPGSVFPLVSTKEKQAHKRISDLRDLIDNAKIEIPLAKKPTQSEVKLWNGTTFEAFTGSPGGSRGDGARSILFDEMAHMEDQRAMTAAFNPMMALSSGKMVMVSTPLAPNDLFMRTWERGDEHGQNGIISLYQPTFNNADEIDPEVSLFQQEIEPARPDLNIARVESDRLQDPKNFAQEYLCESIDESYRFFSAESVRVAMDRVAEDPEYALGEFAQAQQGGLMVMGVDVATTHDDTALAVFEHVDDRRFMRHREIIDERAILKAGIGDPDRGNPEHVIPRIVQVANQMRVDFVVIDSTGGYGDGPARMLETRLSAGVVPFNFSDKDSVASMMGDMNAALRSDRVWLADDPELEDQLCAIVKEQKEYTKPRFSGKDYSESGKDDLAMACVLAAFPPGFTVKPSTDVASKPQHSAPTPSHPAVKYGERTPDPLEAVPQGYEQAPVYGSTRVQRGPRRSYSARYARSRTQW